MAMGPRQLGANRLRCHLVAVRTQEEVDQLAVAEVSGDGGGQSDHGPNALVAGGGGGVLQM
jgi:hypothetical protein